MISLLFATTLAAVSPSSTTMAVSAYVMPITASAVAAVPSPQRRQALLFEAARLGRTDLIAALIEAGVDVNARDAQGSTPLMIATANDQPDAARTLIAASSGSRAFDRHQQDTALRGVPAGEHDRIVTRPENRPHVSDEKDRAG